MARKAAKDKSQILLFNSDNDVAVKTSTSYYKNLYKKRILAMEAAIKKLRTTDLSNGYCFMVTDAALSDDQAYYLYPDGHIKIEQVNLKNIELERIVLKILNKKEIVSIKKKHAFLK